MGEDHLQNVVDKAKAYSLLQNLHNLSPPPQKDDKEDNKVAIIESLKVSPRLQNLFLELQGLVYDPDKKTIIRASRPIMNVNGAFRFVKICQHIAEEAEWSNFGEEEINSRIYEHYKNNYPYFTFWHEEYDLSPSDFNYISSTLVSFIDSAFHKGKNAKYINAVSRVYSEDFMGKIFQGQPQQKTDVKGFLSSINPFKKP